jgi:DNA-binding MarR family transcriptional regulator
VLENGAGRVPQSDLVDRAGLPGRTARDAFSRLDESGRIDRRPDPDDPHRNIVELAETVST